MQNVYRSIVRRRTGVLGMFVVLAMLVTAIGSPFFAPYDPFEMNATLRFQGPSAAHLFGTDHFGRDVLSRVLHGSRASLLIGLSVGLISAAIGLLAGAASGYFRSVGAITIRIVDAFMAFPAIVIALFLMAIIGRATIWNVIVALTVTSSPRLARTGYALSLQIKAMTYVEAAEALGASRSRVLLRHIVPNMAAPLVVQATFTFAIAILAAAALDFLGVGTIPSLPSWGGMINEGKDYLGIAPWTTVFPGLFLAALVLGLNLVGDALRDALDPRFQLRN